jgi:uncharacterized protein (DUF488 family)
MTERTVYLAGYSRQRPETLLDIAERLNATVLDVRLVPRSRQPGWSKKRLAELLGPRYVHARGFGNLRYQDGGPAELADPEAGLAIYDQIEGALILLCQCRRSEDCHRRDVAAYLAEHRQVVAVEIDWTVETDSPAETDRQGERSAPRQLALEAEGS